MSAIDYDTIATVVRTLLSENGRTVTLNKMDNVPSNSSKPWQGSTTARTAVATLEVSAVFVEPSSLDTLGRDYVSPEFLKRSEQIAFISTDTRLDQFNEMVDSDSTRWRIVDMTELRPGSKSMLYFVGVKK
jgi:hypothetical protein